MPRPVVASSRGILRPAGPRPRGPRVLLVSQCCRLAKQPLKLGEILRLAKQGPYAEMPGIDDSRPPLLPTRRAGWPRCNHSAGHDNRIAVVICHRAGKV